MSSVGNDNRGVRRFLREVGIAPTVANVERMSKEVRRTQTQNENVVRIHKELERARGIPATRDERGDVGARVKAAVKRQIESRKPR